MNDSQDEHNTSRPARSRSVPTRPPIQWPERRAVPQTDKATEHARSQVHRTYLREGEPNTPKPATKKVISPTPSTFEQGESHVMRNEPYDWQQYHNAWQQYYHQYFYRYYASWWQQQRLQNQQTLPDSTAAVQSAQTVFATQESPQATDTDETQVLRSRIRSSVRSAAKRFQTSSHFKPLIGALSVASVFLLLNYNQIMIGAVKQYIAPGNVVTTPIIVEPSGTAAVGPDPVIIIPKIGVNAPVVYDEPRVDNTSYEKALERGVVRLGNSANPGTKGNIVIGGHSSNNVFSPGKYKYVFVNLKQLDVGDIFYLNYNSIRYTYKVTVAHKIITPKDVSVLAQTTEPIVTLFTCDPPGTNIDRLIVQATQIDPNPSGATASTVQKSPDTTSQIPSTSQSLWQRLFGN